MIYGFGLIAFALVLALIYNHMCGLHEADSSLSLAKPNGGVVDSKTAEGGK